MLMLGSLYGSGSQESARPQSFSYLGRSIAERRRMQLLLAERCRFFCPPLFALFCSVLSVSGVVGGRIPMIHRGHRCRAPARPGSHAGPASAPSQRARPRAV